MKSSDKNEEGEQNMDKRVNKSSNALDFFESTAKKRDTEREFESKSWSKQMGLKMT